jgi:hypothetical protein
MNDIEATVKSPKRRKNKDVSSQFQKRTQGLSLAKGERLFDLLRPNSSFIFTSIKSRSMSIIAVWLLLGRTTDRCYGQKKRYSEWQGKSHTETTEKMLHESRFSFSLSVIFSIVHNVYCRFAFFLTHVRNIYYFSDWILPDIEFCIQRTRPSALCMYCIAPTVTVITNDDN